MHCRTQKAEYPTLPIGTSPTKQPTHSSGLPSHQQPNTHSPLNQNKHYPRQLHEIYNAIFNGNMKHWSYDQLLQIPKYNGHWFVVSK
eukprot:9326427-Ditylum_brightwellii.AAC.1